MDPARELPYWPAAMALLIEAGQMTASDYVSTYPDLPLASEGASTDAGRLSTRSRTRGMPLPKPVGPLLMRKAACRLSPQCRRSRRSCVSRFLPLDKIGGTRSQHRNLVRPLPSVSSKLFAGWMTPLMELVPHVILRARCTSGVEPCFDYR